MVEFMCEGTICRLSGRLSQQEVIKLWEQRKQLINRDVDIVNLTDLTYSDSAGIAFILELVSLAKKEGRVLGLTSPSAQLSKLIALYDLELFFNEETKQGKEIHG